MSEVDLTRYVWRKSSRSNTRPESCVEVAAVWRKSSRSDTRTDQCVELAMAGPAVAVRDSKDPDGPKLAFAHANWSAFTRGIKGGAFDAS